VTLCLCGEDFQKSPSSPHLKLNLSISTNQLEISPVGRDEARSMRPGGEGDKNVEMQVTQFGRREAVIGTNARQNFP
jgi:hypothetical protein